MVVCGTAISTIIASTVVVIPLYCDCCGREKLAEIRDGKLIIFDTRHGQRHFVTVEIEHLQVLTNTTKVL